MTPPKLSDKVKLIIKKKGVPAGMYCYGGLDEVSERFATEIKGRMRKIVPSFHVEPIDEPIDPIDELLTDGKDHIIAATWCGACNMQKALLKGFYPLPVYKKNGKRKDGEQKWVKITDVTKEMLDEINMSVEEFKEIVQNHALPEDAIKHVEFHYVDDPDPEKREFAKMLEEAYQPDAFPSHIRKNCNWKEEGKGCLESGVKFKEAFVKFLMKNNQK